MKVAELLIPSFQGEIKGEIMKLRHGFVINN